MHRAVDIVATEMDKRTLNIDPSLRFRYEFLPVTLNSARVKRSFIILIARTTLDEAASNALAQVQLARWYCDDLRAEIDLDIAMIVPENATTTRAVFERYGINYGIIPEIDEANADSLAETAIAIDADVVLGLDRSALTDLLIDDVMLVVDAVDGVLHNVEIHLRGFDVPWSFEYPAKMMPWTNFYQIGEHNLFKELLEEWSASAAAPPDIANKMRILVGHTLPAMCFNRDRMEFYRQQDRWTDRNEIERQNFRFEYTTALNNFYVTMYSGVDLVAAICVDIFGLNVAKEQIYAISGEFKKRRKAVAGLDALFSGGDFWDMYKLPRLIRHEAAHSGPITVQEIYMGDDNFTDEQLDEAAYEHGLYDDLHALEKAGLPLPDFVRTNAIEIARYKAKLKLLGRPLRHGVILPDGKGAIIYNPDPANDLKKFIAFVDRVLAFLKPWDAVRPVITWPEGLPTPT